ncbi:hypothetical protein ROHU_031202 [Labeo rohita]|uniref:Uncharacterized protein n=1 Tax=Labeo rohita TaxID=84645 RepID=A0A498LPY2_LABRO|nr:hypothetical protein ROHU_031202 [Labeo rohita]
MPMIICEQFARSQVYTVYRKPEKALYGHARVQGRHPSPLGKNGHIYTQSAEPENTSGSCHKDKIKVTQHALYRTGYLTESDPAQRCGSYSRTPTHPPPASSNRYMCGPSKLAGLRPQRPSPTPASRAAKRPEPHSDTEIDALLTSGKPWLTSALGVSNKST